MNSAWGESYRLTRDCESQLGRANTTVFWVSFTLRGSVRTFSHFLQLGLSLYLVNRVTVSFGYFFLPLFLSLRVIVFCFVCKYLWAAINVKCIYQKWTLDVLCKTKQIKEKQFEISVKMNCIDFEIWPVNRRFCTRGWRPSKRTPPNNKIYTIWKYKEKQLSEQSHWVPNLLLPLCLRASHHFATWLKVDQID